LSVGVRSHAHPGLRERAPWVLETACDYGYEETEPTLVEARDRAVLVICRSGNRSILAGHTLLRMGYRRVVSLKTGLHGWNDYDLPLVRSDGRVVPLEEADRYFTPVIPPEKLGRPSPSVRATA